MSLNTPALMSGATAMTPTGGTAKTFYDVGERPSNAIHRANTAQTDLRIRDAFTASNTPPVLGSDGTFSKFRRTLRYRQPKILADGSIQQRVLHISIEGTAEDTQSELLEFMMLGAQFLSDSDFADYWKTGNLS